MRDDDLIGRLEALGAAEPDGLDPGRRRAIEARVDAVARGGRAEASARRRPVLMAAAAIVLVVTFGVMAAVLTGDGGPRIEAATGTVRLELPGGAVVPGIAGSDLPDGTVIDVAADSSALVDGVELGPGRYAVRDGRPVDIATDRSPTDRSPTDRSPTAPDVAPTTVVPTRDDTRVSDAPTTTARPRSTTPRTTVGRRDDRPSVTEPPSTSEPPSRPTTTRAPADAPTTAPTTAAPTTTTPTRDRTDRTSTSLPPETTTTVGDGRGDRPGDG